MPSDSERRGPKRKGSSDSTRSRRDRDHRHKPRRNGSSDSVSSRRGHRDVDRYRHRDRTGSLGSVRENDEAEQEQGRGPKRKGSKDVNDTEQPPPSYALSEARDAPKQEGDHPDPNVNPTQKTMTVASRVCWSLCLLLPLLSAVLLLFLITCSSSDLRADFSILKISVSGSDFDSLFTATEDASASAGNSTSVLANAAGLGGVVRRAESDGYLTLGIWGWCVRTKDSSKSACSPASGWYTMGDALNSASNSGISADDFNSFLVHGLVLHGFGLLFAMIAIVPVTLHVWRRYYKINDQVEAGWFQHGTIIGAVFLCLVSWVIDKILSHTVSGKIGSNKVQTGPAVTLVGVACILLVTLFAISGGLVLRRFVRHRHSYISNWREVENASETILIEQQAKAQAEAAAAAATEAERKEKKRKRGERGGRWRNRMTRMFG